MTTFDFSPLFRTSVGYDSLASLLNSATRLEPSAGFPPYNIQKAVGGGSGEEARAHPKPDRSCMGIR